MREVWQKKKLILKVALNKDIASLVESYILIGIYMKILILFSSIAKI